MLVYALVPARSGSKGLPNKNILPIGGHPLIAYSIAFAFRLAIDRVLVSTDSPEYQSVSFKYGAECPYLRGPTASSDTAMEEDILADLDLNLPNYGIPLPDVWVWLKPTSPFRNVAAVQNAIGLLCERETIDSIQLVTDADARLHGLSMDGYLEPKANGWDSSRSRMRRSEFPKCYNTVNLEIFRHRMWREWKAQFMGRRMRPLFCHRIAGLDVDDIEGFEIVKALIEARPRPKIVGEHICL